MEEVQKEGVDDKNPKKWTNLFSGNKKATRGMSLQFKAPEIRNREIIVALDKGEIELETTKWNSALIVYVVGNQPSMESMHGFVANTWNFVAASEVFYHNDDYLLIRFKTMEDRDAILCSGPYTFNSRPIIIKKWKADFDFRGEVLKTIPLWVQLSNLPLNC